jgi:hypothetical protein
MKSLFVFLFTILAISAYAQTEIKLEDISKHVGDSVKVRGKIFGAKYLESAKNSPTFLNVGAAYPNQLLTIVIWGDVRKKLGYAPEDIRNPSPVAIITGKVELYKDKPQIVIYDPAQLVIVAPPQIKKD